MLFSEVNLILLEKMNKQVKRTRQWIFGALLSLLRKKPYDDIKIANITDEAGVARQSFYRNYDSKDDIIIKYFESMIDEYINKVVLLYSEGKLSDYSNVYTLFFEMLLKRKSEILTLKNASLSLLLYNVMWQYGSRLETFFKKSNIIRISDEYTEYLMKYQFGGAITLIIEWINDDMTISPNNMGEMMFKITSNFDHDSSFLPVMINGIKSIDTMGE